MNCKAHGRKKLRVKNHNLKNNQIVNQVKSRNYNSFAPLQEGNLEFFKCYSYGNKASNCRLMEISEKPKLLSPNIGSLPLNWGILD
jgi:hypothetical protein